MAFTLTAAQKNAALDSALPSGLNSGLLRIYSGTAPANADASLSGNTQLAELTLGSTAFAAASAGSKSANTIADDTSADATGTATFFRLLNSAGTTVYCQGSVGTSGAELNLNAVALVAGARISVTSLAISI